jgi:outer membrane receptor protein involved in Fe transport
MQSSQGVLALNASLSWQDETQSVAASTAVYDTDSPADRVRDTPVAYAHHENESRTLLNARLSWSMPMESSNLVVSLWGQNITDEEYGVFGFNYGDALALNLHQYGAPRTVGLDISWEM